MNEAVPQYPSVARDEVLEELWTAAEAGRAASPTGFGEGHGAGSSAAWKAILGELAADGLIVDGDGAPALTAAGSELARELVRRHRLAEVLFHQVLELPMELTEAEACGMEHLLSPQATAAVCTFLGHPPACPHGRPIPPGPCCGSAGRHATPLICRLVDLAPGERGRVVLLAPRQRERLEQLSDLGLVPGAVVVLRQHKPSLVVDVDRTLLALEDEIAAGIYLRPLTEW